MRTMRIWHVGSSGSPELVNGVNAMVWTLAHAQAAAGCDVRLVVDQAPDDATAQYAQQAGVSLIHIGRNWCRFDPAQLSENLRNQPPDVVHLHSVFVHSLTTLAATLRKWRIPYIATLHGGLAPQVLSRRPIRKAVYSALFERKRLSGAAAISFVGPGEKAHLQAYLPGYRKPTPLIPNPVDPESLDGRFWTPPADRKRLVFLGRFDVYGKGIDLLVGVAKHLPDVEMHIYGTEDPRYLDELRELKRSATPNVTFHGPVYGSEKARVLAEATMYVQLSRWEGFPVAVTEAFCLGVPCVINQDLAICNLFRERELGLTVPDDAAAAAKLIGEALHNPQRLSTWAANGQKYAEEQLRPDRAATEYARLYRQATRAEPAMGKVLGEPRKNSNG
jgi:glycosyltransferase involved in cell wall biosynthesis